jgi:Ca2+/Na+ antiporter
LTDSRKPGKLICFTEAAERPLPVIRNDNWIMIWLHFIFSATLVIGGGFYLARHGQELGERYGLTELWVGFIFLAAVTSIPELATALGAVTVACSPDLALRG